MEFFKKCFLFIFLKKKTEPTADETRLSEQEREVANLGRPKLGDIKLVKVSIHESEEFRVSFYFLSFVIWRIKTNSFFFVWIQ